MTAVTDHRSGSMQGYRSSNPWNETMTDSAAMNRLICEKSHLTDGELDGIAGGRSRLIMRAAQGVSAGADGSGLVWRPGFRFPPPSYPPC